MDPGTDAWFHRDMGMRGGSTMTNDDVLPILELARDITGTLDLQEVLATSLAGLRRLVPFGGGSIQLVEPEGLHLVAADPPAPKEAFDLRVPIGTGVGGIIALTGQPIYIPDIHRDPRVPGPGRRALSPGIRSYFGVPLILSGHPIGILQVDSPQIDGFPPAARALVTSLAPAIAAAVQNAQLYARELATIEELRAAHEMKNDFLSMVSHELRTPLTSLTGFAELLAQRGDTLEPDLVAEFGRRMWRASRWLSRMIGDLLDLSLIERGTLVLDVRPTDVDVILDDVTAIGVRDERPLERTADPDLPQVLADPDRLRQVLGNLLSNARKFSPPGSAIGLETRRAGNRVEVTVRDRGRGIAPEQLDRIFRAFVQTDPTTTREAGGLGTGLFLVKELCHRMGADVRVESRESAGSSFTVSLPCTKPVERAG